MPKKGDNYENAIISIADELIGYEGINASRANELAEGLLEQHIETVVLGAAAKFVLLLETMSRKDFQTAIEVVTENNIPADWKDFINALPNKRIRKVLALGHGFNSERKTERG